MPNYTYKCDKCDIYTDVFHSIYDNPIIECPSCKQPTRRVIDYIPCIQYNCSGFYSNDPQRKSDDIKGWIANMSHDIPTEDMLKADEERDQEVHADWYKRMKSIPKPDFVTKRQKAKEEALAKKRYADDRK